MLKARGASVAREQALIASSLWATTYRDTAFADNRKGTKTYEIADHCGQAQIPLTRYNAHFLWVFIVHMDAWLALVVYICYLILFPLASYYVTQCRGLHLLYDAALAISTSDRDLQKSYLRLQHHNKLVEEDKSTHKGKVINLACLNSTPTGSTTLKKP